MSRLRVNVRSTDPQISGSSRADIVNVVDVHRGSCCGASAEGDLLATVGVGRPGSQAGCCAGAGARDGRGSDCRSTKLKDPGTPNAPLASAKDPLNKGWMEVPKWGISREGDWEPLVTPELWSKVQSRRKDTLLTMREDGEIDAADYTNRYAMV